MKASSRLGKQLAQVVSALDGEGVRFALIGGLALASHKVIRATQDLDLLIDADDGDRAERLLAETGYRCLHRSADAANYQRGDERIDFLYARRPIARRLLATAVDVVTIFGPLRVVSAEGIIAFKLQALVNEPNRTQDREDMKALLRANRDTLDLEEVREYFRLFGREPILDEMLQEIS